MQHICAFPNINDIVIYPNIKVELNTYSNNADGNVALNTAIIGGEYDVVASFEIHNVMNRIENGMYLDLTDLVKQDNVSLMDNWGTESYNQDGKTYVLPCGGFSYFVAINKDAWDAAGLGEIPEEWTWDEYIDACRKMTEYNADGTVAVPGGSNYSVIADLTNIVYQVNGCNRFYNADGTCSFENDYLKDTIQKFIDAEKEGMECLVDNPLESIIRVNMIDAQRGLSDPDKQHGSDIDRTRLSTKMRGYYDKYLDPEKTPLPEDLAILVATEHARKTFDDNLENKFKPAIKELEELGYPGVANPRITITSKVTTSEMLRHDSAVQYALGEKEDEHLPERKDTAEAV